MSTETSNKICVVIGASHAGVNFAFALRKEGWEGEIILFDRDPEFPYHRPPLSKAYLTSEEGTTQDLLFPKQNYETDRVSLRLGETVSSINRKEKSITISDGSVQQYDKLVLTTGARPFIPPIKGLNTAKRVFAMRTAEDAINIRKSLNKYHNKVVIIGGGYIGLETAASLSKLGASVTVLEREERVLSRVTAPEMSTYFKELHQQHGVSLRSNKNVTSVDFNSYINEVQCDDGSSYKADIIIVGVGIIVNTELAEEAGLEIENGIKVDANCKTNDEDIYALGDCTFHYNPHYKKYIRLESVQNAVDQAKVAAKSICGEAVTYNAIPWFWSDQYDVKLQMVGLSQGYNHTIKRIETDRDNCQSVWYFKDDELLAVDAINNAKAYMLGTRFIQKNQKIDKHKLSDISIAITPTSFI
ncbi:3-phenylpropionate/trans-cinnamate dioxygenase ferredoxin reductase subunit [Maribacter spongiicola]|uniref:3-phenylpropionate/trans-cinnamate dioxygenase ferredoxin reductase subunit n=1 Tax=Maribacter spongiicola TaxID=1206753 RepID=A0A4V3ERS5_9FLAO|nr:FAD-dependent oxidoreductase [Maribacter spongiicola]TDT47333.1 3-phenylpropionate/trans-cinnamate dioxygenase ferredoxin reductase subunit [Maribacter spongiicola]